MNFSSLVKTIIVSTVIIHIIGCSSSRTLPPPPQLDKVKINYIEDELSGWTDLPIGVYRVPNSQSLISGHQSNASFGILFGVLGVAIQSSIESSKGKTKVEKSRELLTITLTKEAKEITQELTSLPQFSGVFTDIDSESDTTLDIQPALVFTYHADDEVKPYVLLQVSLKEESSQKLLWNSRYIASLGQGKPLVGDNSWESNSGELLRENISQNLKKAIEVMLSDISSPYIRDEEKKITVQGHHPYMRKKFQTFGYELFQDESYIGYLPLLGDAVVFSGVNIMDKEHTTIRPFESGDSGFKIIEGETVEVTVPKEKQSFTGKPRKLPYGRLYD
ncbi:hypothetical protein ACVBE9_09190 [Eionea flava]